MSDIRITTNGVRITIHIDVEPIPHHYDLDAEDQRYQEEQREANRLTDAELVESIMEASADELEELAEKAADLGAVDEVDALVAELDIIPVGVDQAPVPSTPEAVAMFTLGAPEPAQVEPLHPPEEIVTPEMAELRALQATEKKPRKTHASPKPPEPDPDEKPDPAAEESRQDRMMRSELALKIPIGERNLGLSAKDRVDGREQFGHGQTLQTWTLVNLQTYYDYLKDAIHAKEARDAG